MCIEIERECVCVCVWRERERDGIGPVTVRVWPRIGVRLRVIMHFIFWHFVRFFMFSGILSVHVFCHFARIPRYLCHNFSEGFSTAALIVYTTSILKT